MPENEKTPDEGGLPVMEGFAEGLQSNTNPQSFIARGWRIFPVYGIDRGKCTCRDGAKCQSPGKHPRTRYGVKDATNDIETVRVWAELYPETNWGVACGPGSDLFVVDVDPRNGGFDSITQVAIPKDALTVLTGGGGLHYYFCHVDGVKNGKWLPGVDLKTEGGYVVLPGSSHISGGFYMWKGGHETRHPTVLPQATVQRIRDDQTKGPEAGAGESLKDSASILEGVPEGQRDDTLFKWACRLRRLHSSDRDGGRAVVTQLVLTAAANCTPPFPRAQALVKVEQAFKQDHDDEVIPPSRDRLVFGGGFILDEPDDIPAVWGDGEHVLWAEGEGLMIAGHQGLGKTTIAQQLVLARAGILPDRFLGHTVALSDKPTLYLAMDRPRQAARSFRRMVSNDDRPMLDARLVVWRGPLPVDPTVKGKFRQWVREVCPDVGLVVVDSVKDLVSNISDGEVGQGLNSGWQDVIADGIELLLLHHERKAPQDSRRKPTLDNIYGSTWLTSGLGSVIALSGDPGDAEVSFHHVKQPGEEVGPLMVVHDHANGVTTTQVVEHISVEMALTMHARMTMKELQRASGRSRASVLRDLALLGNRVTETKGVNTGAGLQPSTWEMVG